jgi:hypothetical protein
VGAFREARHRWKPRADSSGALRVQAPPFLQGLLSRSLSVQSCTVTVAAASVRAHSLPCKVATSHSARGAVHWATKPVFGLVAGSGHVSGPSVCSHVRRRGDALRPLSANGPLRLSPQAGFGVTERTPMAVARWHGTVTPPDEADGRTENRTEQACGLAAASRAESRPRAFSHWHDAHPRDSAAATGSGT